MNNQIIYTHNNIPYKLIKIRDKEISLKLILELLLSKEFFSLTTGPIDDENETSLIISQNTFDLFISQNEYKSNFIIDPEVYYSMNVLTSASALGLFGIIADVSMKFAECKIPILCLSTFSLNLILYPKKYYDVVRKEFISL